MKSVKKIIVFTVILLILSGCNSYSYRAGEQPLPTRDYYSNLDGLTRISIIKKFGEPTSKETSYNFRHRIDKWYYRFSRSRDIQVIFIDGCVSEVHYD